MGLDVTAKLIVGVHLELRSKLTKRTKYNEDTGVPYEITEERAFHVIEGTDIEVEETEDLTESHTVNEEGRIVEVDRDLALFYADRNDRTTWFLGSVVTEVQSLRTSGPMWAVVPPVIEAMRLRVGNRLQEQFGYYHRPVGVFLINEVS